MTDNETSLWTILLVLTALLLSLVVLAQILANYANAYFSAPREIATFIDTVDFSIKENESLDGDVTKVQRLDDKLRLGQLLREIQKCGDDLREELNTLLVAEHDTRMRTSARLLWAAKRKVLEERVRRLDMLRMRFLVVYMGIVAAGKAEKPVPVQKEPERDREKERERERDRERDNYYPPAPVRSALSKALAEGIKQKPPLRRLTTQAIGHNANVANTHRNGWAGVVQELHRSPMMHKRRASIEMSMAKTP